MDEEKIRKLEETARDRLISKGWTPLGGEQFRGYLFKVVDGEKRFMAPDDMGSYYLRG